MDLTRREGVVHDIHRRGDCFNRWGDPVILCPVFCQPAAAGEVLGHASKHYAQSFLLPTFDGDRQIQRDLVSVLAKTKLLLNEVFEPNN